MCLNLNYWLIAPTGQVPTHEPQSMQVPSSQADFPSSSNERAPTGHPPTQAPHPMQASLSIFTAIVISSLFNNLYSNYSDNQVVNQDSLVSAGLP